MSKNKYNNLLEKLQQLLVNKNIDVKRISYNYIKEIDKDDLAVQFNGKRTFAFLILIKMPNTKYYQLIWSYYERKLFSKKIENIDSIKTLIYSEYAEKIINLIDKYVS